MRNREDRGYRLFSGLHGKHIQRAFVREWVSSKDLLRMVYPYHQKACHHPKPEQALEALIELFSRNDTSTDIECQGLFLNARPDLSFALQEPDFRAALDKSLQSTLATGLHRYKIWHAMSNYRISTRMNDIEGGVLPVTNPELLAIIDDPESYLMPLLTKLDDHNERHSLVRHLGTIRAFIPRLKAAECSSLIAPVLATLNDADSLVRNAALTTFKVLIPRLEATECSALVAPVLAKLSDADSVVRHTALETLAVLILRLEATECSSLVAPVLAKLNDAYEFVRNTALKTLGVLIPRLGATECSALIAPVLAMVKDSDISVRRAALNTLNACLPRLRQEELAQIITSLKICLNDRDFLVRIEAFNLISRMMHAYPELEYDFDGLGRSVEVVALRKMREMQAIIQHQAITKDTLKTILNGYQTKSWLGQWLNHLRYIFCCIPAHQSRAMLALHVLLGQKQDVYAKEDIIAALNKDNHAERRLRLFNSGDERPMEDSGTDQVICDLKNAFQT